MSEDPFSWFYLPTAIFLGALHGLEPGHAKTLTASYLIGIKGTKRDALLLGLAVATTHSIIVVSLSLIATYLGQESFTQDTTMYLQVGSGVLVIILGSWMLFKRIRRSRKKPHHHSHSHHHNHDHLDDDEHAKAHAADIPAYVGTGERPTKLQILIFGAAGGMIPCPASITVMLLALSVGKVAHGLFAVLGFSLGLAIALVGVGLAVVLGINKVKSTHRFLWISTQAPVISALVVILSGVAALLFVR